MRKRSGQVHSRESSATLQLTVSLLYRDVKNSLLFTLQRGKLNSEKKQKGVCDHE